MRVQKSHSVYGEQDIVYPRFVEPNQAFTPRQIIDQFSRGEISAKSFEETDSIYDDSYTDDNMVDNVIEFEDQFEATEFMKTTKVIKFKPKKKKDDSSVKADSEGGTISDDEGSNEKTE